MVAFPSHFRWVFIVEIRLHDFLRLQRSSKSLFIVHCHLPLSNGWDNCPLLLPGSICVIEVFNDSRPAIMAERNWVPNPLTSWSMAVRLFCHTWSARQCQYPNQYGPTISYPTYVTTSDIVYNIIKIYDVVRQDEHYHAFLDCPCHLHVRCRIWHCITTYEIVYEIVGFPKCFQVYYMHESHQYYTM